MAPPRVLFFMADYGHDPTETAVPYSVFRQAGWEVHFATEHGKVPKCDDVMMKGWTQKALGATQHTLSLYAQMQSDLEASYTTSTKEESSSPIIHAWTSPTFSTEPYTCLFFPGGHEKSVRQVIEAEPVHRFVGDFFTSIKRDSTDKEEAAAATSSSSPSSNTLISPQKTSPTPRKKGIAAVCHGVQTLSNCWAWFPDPTTPTASSSPILSPLTSPSSIPSSYTKRSILTPLSTTALPTLFEQPIYHLTSPLLGTYYKTYGAGSASVEDVVKGALADPKTQWKCSLGMRKPFVVEDEGFRYWSGRWPADSEELCRRTVEGLGGDYIETE